MPINVNDNFKVNAPKHIDNRAGKFTAGKWRPWVTVEEFLTAVPVGSRYESELTYIYKDGTQESIDTYWFVGGVEDENLVLYKTDVDLTQILADIADLQSRVLILEGNQTQWFPDVIVFTYDGTNNVQPLSFTPKAYAGISSINKTQDLVPAIDYYFQDDTIVISPSILTEGIEYTILTNYLY